MGSGLRWLVLNYQQTWVDNTMVITFETDIPTHIWLRHTDTPPLMHLKSLRKRGLALMKDPYYCFVAWQEIEQVEAGDTLSHTFTWPDWYYGFEEWFYFRSEVAGEASPTQWGIFHKRLDRKTFIRQVAHVLDDCQRGEFLGSDYFGTEYGYNAAGWLDWRYKLLGCGMRFLDIPIPHGAGIVSAKLTFIAHSPWGGTNTMTRIRGQLGAFAAPFSTMADFDARPRTVINVDWDFIPPWTVGLPYDSPDLSGLILEMTSHPDWVSGSPLVLFWDDFDGRTLTGEQNARYAQSYDSVPAGAPLLTVTYKP